MRVHFTHSKPISEVFHDNAERIFVDRRARSQLNPRLKLTLQDTPHGLWFSVMQFVRREGQDISMTVKGYPTKYHEDAERKD